MRLDGAAEGSPAHEPATEHAWTTRVFGAFREFENREVKWYANEKAELRRVFHDEGSLPFQFGYAQSGGHGVLLAAWLPPGFGAQAPKQCQHWCNMWTVMLCCILAAQTLSCPLSEET